jgi:spore coat protein H
MKPGTFVILSLFFVASGTGTASAQTQDAFFQGDALQDIRLRISARDWQTLKANAELDTYYPADLTWNGITVRNVGIRSRGNTTRNGVKPGLRVDINRYLSDQEFLGLKAFALDNAYSYSPKSVCRRRARRMRACSSTTSTPVSM